jgi:AsmA protein
MARRLVWVAAVLAAICLAGVLLFRSRFADDRIKAALEAQASAYVGEPVRIGALDFRLFPRPGLTLSRVSVGGSSELTIDRLVLSTGLRPLLSRRIAEADIIVDRSRLDAPRFFALLTKPRPEAAPASGSAGFQIDAIRSIALRSVTLASGGRTLLVNADLSYSARGLEVERVSASAEHTTLTASGAVTDLARRVGHFTINAASLDLDGLIEFAAPFGGQSASSSSSSGPLDITLQIAAKTGRAIGAEFSGLAAMCRLTSGRVVLEPLKLSLFGGGYNGAVSVRTATAQPQYDWRGTFTGIDVAQLARFAGASGTITGTLQSRGTLHGAGSDVQRAFTGATGNVSVNVRDGAVPGLEIVRTVILAFGRPSGEAPQGSGERFSELAADFAVGNRRATTDNLTFASRDFDMHGRGWIDLGTHALKLDADIVLSQELSKQAGRDLYRYASEGDRIVLPARIAGTAEHPSVTVDVAAALARAAKNQLKEKAKSFLKGIIRRP